MNKVNTYLNFDRKTEEAFNFYKSVFGGEFDRVIMRYKDIPPQEGMPTIPEADKELIMHISLPIMDGHRLMGTDVSEAMGSKLIKGNNVYISIAPDTRAETKRLYEALSAGGKVEMELQDMFWGDYYASFEDKFGTKWMLNCSAKE